MSDNIFAQATGDRNQLAVPPSQRDRHQGSLNAKVVLVEYGDYQCSQCGELHTLIQTVQEGLNTSEQNDLCFVYRHFPQPRIHPQAQKAAAAAEAAAAKGQFWQMHDILFAHQQDLGDGYLAEYADNLGLDVTQFVRDLYRQVHVARINEDIESGLQSGVTAAPALFINRIQYSGRWNIEQLQAAIVAASH
ncbi:MAG: DsbA family protein [Nostoc sp. ChiSLP02]|nr:DsbA family protein [Nostoc sp. DedSLP05]MDZ8102313.1 DsbA family protein [Nostoc sp. DedSLP01]MDZ8188388.1 DsbA family protein [Nostoc sp. ChiSLP02]